MGVRVRRGLGLALRARLEVGVRVRRMIKSPGLALRLQKSEGVGSCHWEWGALKSPSCPKADISAKSGLRHVCLTVCLTLTQSLTLTLALYLLDILLGEDGGGSADGAQVEAPVLLAGRGHCLGAVALGQCHERTAVLVGPGGRQGRGHGGR